jgi:RNA polymerase sigma-70 factor (ECF subfamily)
VIKHSSVSRCHARLAVKGQHMEVSDAGSANGTFRNDQRISTAMVTCGDTLQFGAIRVVLEDPDTTNVPPPTEAAITQMLNDLAQGNEEVANRLLPLIYDNLRRLARSYLRREARDHTLQPTALVHEAYLRLLELEEIEWQSRAHFFAVASQMMRRVLVDHGRRRHAVKRGRGLKPVELEEGLALSENRLEDVVIVDELLMRLEARDPEQHRVVELRFFGGLTVEETAQVMGISASTVKRYWLDAQEWFRHEVTRNPQSTPGR